MKTKLLFLSLGMSFVISGCSTHGDWTCPYGESCAPVDKVHDATFNDTSSEGWSVWDDPHSKTSKDNWDSKSKSKSTKKSKEEARSAKLAIAVDDSIAGAQYHPPKPYQIWLAPWIDDSEVLHSGSYAWFTTPAYWTYAGVKVSEGKMKANSSDFDFQPTYIPEHNFPKQGSDLKGTILAPVDEMNEKYGPDR